MAVRRDRDVDDSTSPVVVNITNTSSGGDDSSGDAATSVPDAVVSIFDMLKTAKAWGIVLYIITLAGLYVFGFRIDMFFNEAHAPIVIPLLLLFPFVWLGIMLSMHIQEYRAHNEIVDDQLSKILNPPEEQQQVLNEIVANVVGMSNGMATVTSVLTDVTNALNNAPQSASIRVLVRRHVLELPLYIIIPIARFKSQVATSVNTQGRDVAMEGLRTDLADKSKIFINAVVQDSRGMLTADGRHALTSLVNDACATYFDMVTNAVNEPLEAFIPRICNDWETRSEENFNKHLDVFIAPRVIQYRNSSNSAEW